MIALNVEPRQERGLPVGARSIDCQHVAGLDVEQDAHGECSLVVLDELDEPPPQEALKAGVDRRDDLGLHGRSTRVEPVGRHLGVLAADGTEGVHPVPRQHTLVELVGPGLEPEQALPLGPLELARAGELQTAAGAPVLLVELGTLADRSGDACRELVEVDIRGDTKLSARRALGPLGAQDSPATEHTPGIGPRLHRLAGDEASLAHGLATGRVVGQLHLVRADRLLAQQPPDAEHPQRLDT